MSLAQTDAEEPAPVQERPTGGAERVQAPVESANLSRAVAAPLPLDQLIPMLESAGMTLAQTDAEKLAQVQARIAAEPPEPHVARVRPESPPPDVGPLVQVETRHASAPPLG